jgi:type I restriction enzyme S subunit
LSPVAVIPVRRYLTSIKDGTHGTHERVSSGVPLLSAKNIRDGGVAISEGESLISEQDFEAIDRSGYLAPGDVLLTIVGTIGRTAIYGGDRQVAFQRSVASLRPGPACEARYLSYCLDSSLVQDQLAAMARQSAQAGVYLGDVATLRVPLMPIEEQRAIADYLDRETARIDALIAAKRRMVELIDERRVASIARLVTPTSGASGWQLQRLRHVVRRLVDTEHKTVPFYVDGEFLVIRTTNISKGRLIVGPGSKFTDAAGYHEWTRRGVPEAGDILLTREAPAGEACLVPQGMQGCVGQRTVLLKVDEARVSARYCLWALYGGIARSFIDELSQGSTLPHLNMSDISDIPLWVPDLETQGAIADVLDRLTTAIDETVDVIERQIDLLGERRQALITAAIVGQLDTPNAP